MVGVYISLGSNVGERSKHLTDALNLISERCGNLIDASAVYESEPWGKLDQAAFLNQVILIETSHSPIRLLEELKNIEVDLGRVQTEKWGPRSIDLDILFFGDQIVNQNKLIIPHPHLQNRRFVLVPLNEVASKFIHPTVNQTIEYLLEQCTDNSDVHRISAT